MGRGSWQEISLEDFRPVLSFVVWGSLLRQLQLGHSRQLLDDLARELLDSSLCYLTLWWFLYLFCLLEEFCFKSAESC